MAFLQDAGDEILITHYNNPSVMLYSHTHPNYELYFCTDNIAQKSVVNGVEYKYSYPCVIISSPYTVHSMSCDDPSCEAWERYVIYFNKSTFELFKEDIIPQELYKKNSGLLFKLTPEQSDYLKDLLAVVAPESVIEKELTLALFFNKLLKFCPIEKAETVGRSSTYIQDVLQYIVENISKPIGTDPIARHFAVSRSKLDRDFKYFTGSTVHSFIDNCRLNEAKLMLKNNIEMPVIDIAKLCGFTNDSYFFSFFKKNIGITPLEYRNKKSNSPQKEN